MIDISHLDKKQRKKLLKGITKALEKLSEAKESYYNAFAFSGALKGGTVIMDKIQELETLFRKPLYQLSEERRLLIDNYSLNPISEFGDHMSFKKFKNCCEGGGFIDYDGSGNYATKDKESNITIMPSDFKNGNVRDDFTHVVWYNK